MKKILISSSSEATMLYGANLAKHILETSPKDGVVLGLVGELGSGKTTFVQGLAKGFGLKGRIISPTFILIRSYSLRRGITFKTFHHIDLYRLESDEVKTLDLAGLWSDSKTIVVVEWADKIKRYLPKKTIWLSFLSVSGSKRRIKVEGEGIDAIIH